MRHLPTALQILGALLLVVVAFEVRVIAGVVALALVLIVAGVLLERPIRKGA